MRNTYELIYEEVPNWLELIKPVDSMTIIDDKVEMERVYVSKHLRINLHPLFKIVRSSHNEVSIYQYDILGHKYEPIDSIVFLILLDSYDVFDLMQLVDKRLFYPKTLKIIHDWKPKWVVDKGEMVVDVPKVAIASTHLLFEADGVAVPMYHLTEHNYTTEIELTTPFLDEEVFRVKINATRDMNNRIREDLEDKPRGTYL